MSKRNELLNTLLNLAINERENIWVATLQNPDSLELRNKLIKADQDLKLVRQKIKEKKGGV